MSRALLSLGFLASIGTAFAAPAPPPETADALAARVAAAKAARTLQDAAPGTKSMELGDGRLVLFLYAFSGEPVPEAIRYAHSAAVQRLERKTARPDDWIVNLEFGAFNRSVQFRRQTPFSRPPSAMTAEAWFDELAFNGASEKGVIDMARWCRRGGEYQLPTACARLRAEAIERGVWAETAR